VVLLNVIYAGCQYYINGMLGGFMLNVVELSVVALLNLKKRIVQLCQILGCLVLDAKENCVYVCKMGASTFSIMALGINTLSINTLINGTDYNDIQH
jgi:hypothetical protein